MRLPDSPADRFEVSPLRLGLFARLAWAIVFAVVLWAAAFWALS